MMLSSKPTGKARVRAFVMVPAMALALIGLATPAVSAVINEVSAATPVEDLRYKLAKIRFHHSSDRKKFRCGGHGESGRGRCRAINQDRNRPQLPRR